MYICMYFLGMSRVLSRGISANISICASLILLIHNLFFCHFMFSQQRAVKSVSKRQLGGGA